MSSKGRNRPRFRTTDIKAIIREIETKPTFYPTYVFSGRTFVKRDVPGKKPQQ